MIKQNRIKVANANALNGKYYHLYPKSRIQKLMGGEGQSLGDQTADIYKRKRDFKICRQKPTTADKNPVPTNTQPLFDTNKTKRKDHHQSLCRKAPLNGPDLPTQPHPIGHQSHQHFQHFNHWSTLRDLGGSPLTFPYSILYIKKIKKKMRQSKSTTLNK